MQSASTKTLLVLSLVLFIVLGGAFGYEVFAIYGEGRVANELATKVGAGAAGDKLIQDLKKLQSEHQNDLAALDNLAVKKDTLVSFLELLETTGTSLGLKAKVNSVNVDQNKSAST